MRSGPMRRLILYVAELADVAEVHRRRRYGTISAKSISAKVDIRNPAYVVPVERS